MFVDTNVILRWLLDDHESQGDQVSELIDNSGDGGLIISDVTLAEIYFVLRGMNYDNQQIAFAIDALVEEPTFGFDNETVLTRQLEIIRDTRLDFADCYLIARAIWAGEPLKTFDKPMQKAYAKYKAA